MTGTPVFSQRVLNRTLLQRQFLLERTSRGVPAVIEHLVAMQAQEPNWPYVGLWTRLAGFRHEALTYLLHDGTVVRSTMLRVTQHLAGAADYAWLRPALQPLMDRHVRASYYTEQTNGLDLAEVTATAVEFLGDRTVPRRELNRMLAERYPRRKGAQLAGAVETRWGWCTPRRAARGARGAAAP
nr:crosslink repair DNA glycosylase YcaQ family protein [Allosalinactinospora lopnorensis]